MLARSASRARQRRHVSQLLAADFACLNLPWLAPAQLRWNATHATATPVTPSKVRSTRKTPALSQTRHLATSADTFALSSGHYLPPNVFPNSTTFDGRRQQERGAPLYEFGGLRRPSASYIRLNDSQTFDPDPILTIQAGHIGSLAELLQHLNVCIRIGRVSRAEQIVQRLALQTSPNAPEVIYAHELFMSLMLEKIESHGRDSEKAIAAYSDLQRWFEVVLRGRGTSLNEKTLATMMKASIRTLSTSRRDRAIRRYADIAREVDEDMLEKITQLPELTDSDVLIIAKALSEDASSLPELDVTDISTDVGPDLVAHQEVASLENDQQHVSTPTEIDDLPQALPVSQTNRGLASIKFVLEEFGKLAPAAPDASEEEKVARAQARQRVLEESSVDAAVKSWKAAARDLRKIGIHTVMQSKPMAALMWQWQEALVPLIRQELSDVKASMDENDAGQAISTERRIYGPYLELLPPDKIAAVTILHVLASFSSIKSTNGSWDSFLKIAGLTASLGEVLRQEAVVEINKSRMPKKTLSASQNRKISRILARKQNPSSNDTERAPQTNPSHIRQLSHADVALTEWPKMVTIKIGALLLTKLMAAAQLPVTRKHPRTGELVTQMQPAFLHRVKYILGRRNGIITANQALQEKLKVEPAGGVLAKRMPMVVEPKPWTGWNEGGYFHYPTSVARMDGEDGTGRQYFLAAMRKGDLQQVFAGLTALGKVPWKVDKDVLAVQLEAWNSGEAIGNFAPHHPEIKIPPEPDATTQPAERRQWLRQVAENENKRNGLHAQRCFQNFQLEIARTMADETLYFPHNMDFRGRAYPVPPYLNHMGADNVRGLLTFAKGKVLGERGLRWLKIHLATVAGYDKASLEERVEFTMKNLDNITDSARRPLNGNKWWMKSEDSWQTLAACFELTRALDSPDPLKYVSHLPVHQDGTCNGLQHYAALGGDEAGARQVNLEPGDRPADVYTAVADAVREHVKRDAENGNPIAMKLHGRITRKCVKQPVMTNVYGVTFYGARTQVRKQLEDIFPEVGMYDTINLGHLSLYVTTKIFQCLGDMFRGAQAIQDWLGTCAGRISTYLTAEQIAAMTATADPSAEVVKKVGNKRSGRKGFAVAKRAGGISTGNAAGDEHDLVTNTKPFFKSTVVWTTPLGIPVVQPYRSTDVKKTVQTNLQQVMLNEPQMWHPVSKRKQLQGFPPNFIHSLDATHMLLSAVKCTEIGLSFASVHDSFWTHACDIDTLSSVLRDAFVKIHSDDVIVRLREELTARYQGGMYLASVHVSPETAKKISQARKASVNQGKSELAIEAERLKLLSSKDGDEQARGKAMVTPASLVSATEDADAGSDAAQELGEHRLGRLPISALNTDANEIELSTGSEYEATNSDADADCSTDIEAVAGPTTVFDETSVGQAVKESMAESPMAPIDPALKKMHVWLPMSFPPVPAKGNFDVTRLRESKYFFH